MKQSIASKLKFVATMALLLGFIYLNLMFQDSLGSANGVGLLNGQQNAKAQLLATNDQQSKDTANDYPAEDDC